MTMGEVKEAAMLIQVKSEMSVRFLLKEDARTVGLCNPHYLHNVKILSVTNDPNHNHG